MEKKKRYRHELKFMIPYQDHVAMRQRLRLIMSADPHAGSDGQYRIRSIYFDNEDDKALREKIDGIAKREKFRIRYYNDDLSFISLEKKMKIGDLCLKFDTPISIKQCRRIADGDIDWMKDTEDELIKELYAKMRYQRLRPKVLVSYTREPYIYRPGNVRVTFDSNIRTSLFLQRFLDGNMPDISATDNPDDMLVEVKFDDFLPGIIQDIIRVPDLRQQSFSKYASCRRYG